MKKILILFLFNFIGCATMGIHTNIVYPKISKFIGSQDFIKYKRIAVLPFSDAPNVPQSGQIIQGLTCQILGQMGFDVIERVYLFDILLEQKLSLSGLIDDSQAIELGKLLGVKSIVVGSVGQYETYQRKRDTTYIPWTYSGYTTYIHIQCKQWQESFVSISLRIIDIETGQLIYSGSGYYDIGVKNLLQQCAEYILNDIINGWFESSGVCGFKVNKKNIIESIAKNSPADRCGLQINDKLIKINHQQLQNLSFLEKMNLLCGKPGEEIILDIDRNGQRYIFEITRDYREYIFEKR